jgi:hypothetical protein
MGVFKSHIHYNDDHPVVLRAPYVQFVSCAIFCIVIVAVVFGRTACSLMHKLKTLTS